MKVRHSPRQAWMPFEATELPVLIYNALELCFSRWPRRHVRIEYVAFCLDYIKPHESHSISYLWFLKSLHVLKQIVWIYSPEDHYTKNLHILILRIKQELPKNVRPRSRSNRNESWARRAHRQLAALWTQDAGGKSGALFWGSSPSLTCLFYFSVALQGVLCPRTLENCGGWKISVNCKCREHWQNGIYKYLAGSYWFPFKRYGLLIPF